MPDGIYAFHSFLYRFLRVFKEELARFKDFIVLIFLCSKGARAVLVCMFPFSQQHSAEQDVICLRSDFEVRSQAPANSIRIARSLSNLQQGEIC